MHVILEQAAACSACSSISRKIFRSWHLECQLLLYCPFSRSYFLSFFPSHVRGCSSAAAQRIMTKLGQDDHWPESNSSYNFDPRVTFGLDIGLKKWFCYKMYLLLQITCDGNVVRLCDSTLVGAPGILWDKGSKVIKGSFTVKVWKTWKHIALHSGSRSYYSCCHCQTFMLCT